MNRVAPVLTVLGLILVIWYAATVWLNSTWVYDQAEREGRTVAFSELLPATMAQDRPLLPAAHQVAGELWKGIAGQKVTSERSLVYHGYVALQATLYGFVLGIGLGVALGVAIVFSRAVGMSVVPSHPSSEFAELIRKELDHWGRFVRSTGLRPS